MVFERFTERARQVVVLAQEEARSLSHAHVDTEHILLGLAREQEGLAARVLDSLGVTVERVRAQLVGSGDLGAHGGNGPLPFSPGAKQVLQLALTEALALGHNYIGTEHVLLGLTRADDGVATRVLIALDADPEKVRAKLSAMLSGRRVAAWVTSDVDQSGYDFTPAEAFDLTMRLAPLSHRITFDVRSHAGREPTFRLSCRLVGRDNVLRELVALESVGVRAVLDENGTVRLAHQRSPAGSDVAAAGDA